MDGNRITISYPHDLPEGEKHQAAARALCEKMGWTGRLVEGGTKEGSVFVFDPDAPKTAEVVFAGTRRKRGQR